MSTRGFTSGEYGHLRREWERAVRERPGDARASGPPNWMVKEAQRPGEDLLAAAVRVKAEYFGAEVVPASVPVYEEMSPLDVPVLSPVAAELSPPVSGLCEGCSARPKEAGRSLCSGCRKAKQRDR